jgi:hypothetical protein
LRAGQTANKEYGQRGGYQPGGMRDEDGGMRESNHESPITNHAFQACARCHAFISARYENSTAISRL